MPIKTVEVYIRACAEFQDSDLLRLTTNSAFIFTPTTEITDLIPHLGKISLDMETDEAGDITPEAMRNALATLLQEVISPKTKKEYRLTEGFSSLTTGRPDDPIWKHIGKGAASFGLICRDKGSTSKTQHIQSISTLAKPAWHISLEVT